MTPLKHGSIESGGITFCIPLKTKRRNSNEKERNKKGIFCKILVLFTGMDLMRRTEPRLIGKDVVDSVVAVTQEPSSPPHAGCWCWPWRNGARRQLVLVSLVNISRFHWEKKPLNRIFLFPPSSLNRKLFKIVSTFPSRRKWRNNRFWNSLFSRLVCVTAMQMTTL